RLRWFQPRWIGVWFWRGRITGTRSPAKGARTPTNEPETPMDENAKNVNPESGAEGGYTARDEEGRGARVEYLGEQDGFYGFKVSKGDSERWCRLAAIEWHTPGVLLGQVAVELSAALARL